jgi:hypothetical protein
MPRVLQVLFRRDPSRDRQDDRVKFEGYQIFWPDGRAVTVGLGAFCMHGQRLLGLGRHLAGRTECLLDLYWYPLPGRDVDLTRLPGARVRRFFLERRGREGRVHFLDGTPTTIVFDLARDEAPVLHWIGLATLAEGEHGWFDLAARAAAVEPLPTLPVLGALGAEAVV